MWSVVDTERVVVAAFVNDCWTRKTATTIAQIENGSDSWHIRHRLSQRTPESKSILEEKLQYKEKMVKYYENELKASEKEKGSEIGENEDSLDAFMKENDKKLKEMKEKMLREKIETTKKEIETITTQLSKMKSESMNPPTPVLRLKSREVDSRDTSSFRVVDSSEQQKKSGNRSGAYLSSFSSVMDSLKSGNNTSFDDNRSAAPSSASSVQSNPMKLSSNVTPNPSIRNNRTRNTKTMNDSKEVEHDATVEDKPRDMKDYYVPKDMNVAINKAALNEVVTELGENQPAFMRRMIDELKDKFVVFLTLFCDTVRV